MIGALTSTSCLRKLFNFSKASGLFLTCNGAYASLTSGLSNEKLSFIIHNIMNIRGE